MTKYQIKLVIESYRLVIEFSHKAMTKYQIKLVIESYRLVIEFSHKAVI